jgi:glycosyltransferase involved in cell wall biosynthesis
MKKNIWFINQAAGSPYHGMVFRTYYLAHEMVKLGHDVTIFSGSFSHNYFKLPETKGMFTVEMIDGIRYVWVKLPIYPQSKSIGRILAMFLFPLKLLLYKTSIKPDAIIVSSPPPIPVLIGWLWAKTKKAKLIFEVRDIWPLSIQMLGGYGPNNPFIALLRWIEGFAYKRSTFVASVLPKAYLHFEARGMQKGKFLYVPNGVIEEERSLGSSETLNELKKIKRSGKFIVGYAGTIGIANHLDMFIEAAEKLVNKENIQLVIVGEGAHKKRLLELTKKVIFLPAVAKKEIPAVLETFDIGYIGLMKEDLFKFGISPNKIFDYMFAKIPVIMAVDAGNDLVTEANCGISVPSCTSVEIALAIDKIASMPNEERKTLGQNGFNFVNSHHRYDKVVQVYLDKI